jgi:integrase
LEIVETIMALTDTTLEKPKLSAKRKLSDSFLAKHGPAPLGKRITIWDTTPGFGCRITDRGTISFFVMRRRAGERKGKPIRIVLGPHGPRWSVQAARERAKAYLHELVAGIDPRERERKQVDADQQERAHAFRAVVDLYQTRHLQHLDRGLDAWRYIDRELLWPDDERVSWRDRPITKITADDVQERVEAIRDRGKKEAARRLYEVTRGFFVWAKKQRRYKLGELPTNDVDPIGILGKKAMRKTILSDEYLRALWRATNKLGYPSGPYIKLLLLTAVRRKEAASASWDEFSITGKDDDAWIIPAARMKMDAPHIVPITSDIAALLKDGSIPRFSSGKFVFSSSGGQRAINGFTSLKDRLDKLMLMELRALAEERGEDPAKVALTSWRIHDIRRTVRTQLSALDIPEGNTVRELILAHRRPELHEIYDQHAYFREKKFALEEWAKRLKGIVEPTSPVNNAAMLSAKA